MANWSAEAQLSLDSGKGLPAAPEHEHPGMMISLEEAKKFFFAQVALFLDARSQEIYELGHIKGARSLPFDDFEKRFSAVMTDISPEVLIITYCDGETCNLGEDLAIFLFEKGYENVRVLLNGWTLWRQDHMPIEKGTMTSSTGR